MLYEQIIAQLFQMSPSTLSAFSIEKAHILNRALHFPANSYPTIHIAGSNGKGSVSTKIAKTLELSGYRVGLYTSPHLFSFRERITVNGQQIPEEAVVEGMQKMFLLERELQNSRPLQNRPFDATFFELTTFLALEYFRQMGVDVAVIETGLGGRLDATNVINPILSVITSVSREHCQILGEDLEQIAAEKAGIIKPNTPVVIGPKARFQSIYNRAKELHSPLFACDDVGGHFYDEENSAIAALALEHLTSHFNLETAVSKFNLTSEAIKQGLAIRPPCRFERVGEAIFDVAHNPDAISHLIQALHTFFPLRKFRFLVGFSKDKEYDRCLALIATIATHIHLVQANSPRSATTEELICKGRECCHLPSRTAVSRIIKDPFFFTPHISVKEGMKEAYSLALKNQEMLVVCGSFYIMADIRLLCHLKI